MREPRRINLVAVVDPMTGLECLAFYKRDIADARGPAFSPTQCYVIGFCPTDGNHYKFSLPIEVYNRAALAPVHFVECDQVRGPAGVIVDPVGQPFNRPDGGPS